VNRIDAVLQRLKERGEKALTLFVTAGFPELESTVPLVLELVQAGADIIEIGMPFSDPLADGPIIQESSYRALCTGITLERILSQAAEIRRATEVPLVLMGYFTPILSYGVQRFFADAAQAGVDGIIIPETPLEESDTYSKLASGNGMCFIHMVSPTTPAARMKKIDKHADGFVYCVSHTGVTGSSTSETKIDYLRQVSKNIKRKPVLVGFGISSAQDVLAVKKYAAGVIIGSALLRKLGTGEEKTSVRRWIVGIKEECRKKV
jgi:tryptophan synthase alpha chain